MKDRSCENCGTRVTLGCSWYTAEDCGGDFKMWALNIDDTSKRKISRSMVADIEAKREEEK